MKTLTVALISLNAEEVTQVNESLIKFSSDHLFVFKDYWRKRLKDPEDTSMGWGEEERILIETHIKKSDISVIDLFITTPTDEKSKKFFCVTIGGNDFQTDFYFEIEDLAGSRELRDQVTEWLGWS